MRVYVDAAVHQWRGKLWCHLFSPNIDDLHAFAGRLGMRREWFQDPSTMARVSWPHYDITAQKREYAIRKGAVPLGRHQTVVMARVVLNRYHGLVGTEHELDPFDLHRGMGSGMFDRVYAWLDRELTILDHLAKSAVVRA